MSITTEEWQEYADYLDTLSDGELQIEMEWLKSIGEAKKRGSLVSFIEYNTIQ
jgi:hypothetical protein